MPIKDLRSNLKYSKIFNATAQASGVVTTSAVSMATVESLVFVVMADTVPAAHTITITKIEESIDQAFTAPITLSSDKIIGDLTKTVIDNGDFATKMASIGAFSTKDFLRLELTVVGASTVDFSVGVLTEEFILPATDPED